MTPSVSLWRQSAPWRWLVAGAALALGLGLVGQPWHTEADRLAAPEQARFEPPAQRATTAPAPNTPAGPSDAPAATSGTDNVPAAGVAVAPPPATPVPAPRPARAGTTTGTPTGAAQSYSAVTWAAGEFQPIVISGGGLTVQASSGGTHTSTADRAVAEGRHYLELRLSVPPGEGGPSTWGGVGVVPASTLEHGRVFMPRIRVGLGVSVGRAPRLKDGDIVMLAVDANQRLAYWGLNGEWMNGQPGAQGGQTLGNAGGDSFLPFVNVTASERQRTPPEGGERWVANFGASPFRYPLPRGFDSYGSTHALSQRQPLASQGPAADAAPAAAPTDSRMGRVYRDVLRMQDQSIPLPEGDWTVLSWFRDPGAGPATSRGETMVLGRLDGRVLRGLVAVNALAQSAGGTPRAFDACNRQDYVFVRIDAYDPQGEQRCWWINHATGVWQTQTAFRAAKLELERRGVGEPDVMINVAMRRANARGDATAYYYFDPALEGIDSRVGKWADSEWHRTRIDADPARRAYLRKLQAWGEGWSAVFFVSR